MRLDFNVTVSCILYTKYYDQKRSHSKVKQKVKSSDNILHGVSRNS